MKKIGIVALVCLFLFSVYSVLPDLVNVIKTYIPIEAADEIDWEEEENGGGGTTPTVNANYSILEIVPYAGMGEIGYLIGGEEPIDQSMMKIEDSYSFWFSDNSVDKYPSYEDRFMNTSGAFTKTGSTIRYQNGYFKQVLFDYETRGDLYARNPSGFTYVKATQGDYKAVLEAPVDGATTMYSSPYAGDTLMNYRNVNAYFVKKPTTVGLYSDTKKYYVNCVTEVEDNSGDYDYDPETEVFSLNRGHGDYFVIFSEKECDYKPNNSVTNGSGEYYMTNDYEVVTDNSGDYSWSIKYELAGTNMGKYRRVPDSFTYKQYSGGQYQWVQNDVGPTNATLKSQYDSQGYCVENPNTSNERIWIKGQGVTGNYDYTFHIQLVNNEWFKRYMIGVPSAQTRDCHVEVITLTPTELNRPENKHYIEEANLIYIKMTSNSNYVKLYERLNSAATVAASKGYQTSNFQDNDLSWSNAITIFEKAIGIRGARPAVIIENNVYKDAIGSYTKYKKDVTVSAGMWMSNSNDSLVNATGTTNNIAKLYLMLMQRDTREFYDQFINPANPSPYKLIGVNDLDTNISATRSTGSFVRPDSDKAIKNANGTYKIDLYKAYDAAIYWNENTFLPFTIAMDGTITRYIYYNDNNPFPSVRTYVKDDGTKLWKIKEGVALPTNVGVGDTVIWYKVIPKDHLSDYIQYCYFNRPGTSMLNDNVLVIGGWVVMAGSDINDKDFLKIDTGDEPYVDVNTHLISTDQITSPRTSFTLREILNVITNNGQGYANSGTDTTTGVTKTRVLNIEPTADFTASEAAIRAMLSDYTVEFVNMTSTEFNSNMDDINTQYDMIYIGAGAGRFNQISANTVFNNSALNKSVYHLGDRITTSEGVKNYIGNDFTTQKLAELSEYLSAGFPIVMDQAIYTKSVAVQNNTNLYSWLQTKAVPANLNLMNMSQYSSSKIIFMGNLITAMSTERPKIKLLRPVLTETEDVIYVGTDELLDLAFVLQPNGLVADPEIRYKSYLYLDLNGDGIFTESERLNPSTYGITESQYKIYFSSYDMSRKNGVYQWKIKLVKQRVDADGSLHDTPIRSEAKGYTAVTHRQTIQILQITDNPGTDPTVYSLQSKTSVPTSLFGMYYDLNASPRKDYNLAITTLSVDGFMDLYEAEPYLTAKHEETTKLAGYHMVIFDNQNVAEPITDTNGALTNLRYEIADGMGVLYTGGAVNFLRQNNYLADTRNLFANQLTYSRLNMLATTANSYYNFNYTVSGYSGQLQNPATYNTNYLTRTNLSSITQYPYKMGDAIKISTNSYSWDSTIDYDKTATAPLTGWFSLSDSRSPVVRKAGLVSETTANTYTGIYSSSPNDMRNNYYLFNRGKVYYNNIRLDQADAVGNDDEMKLFINTIVACYRTSGRIISIPPSIRITEPTPIANEIALTPVDVGSLTKVPITFKIEKSSSDVTLSIRWDDNIAPEGDWDTQIYRIGTDGAETLVGNLTSVPLGTYRIYIPVGTLAGSHKLTIHAKNKEDKETSLDTKISYVAEPIAIEFINSDLVKNDKNEQYLYIDIDYAAANETTTDTRESDYLRTLSGIRIEFNIDNASSASVVDFNLVDENGHNITVEGRASLRIHKLIGSETFGLGSKEIPDGDYYIDIPYQIMSGVNRAELSMTAMVDSTNKDSSTVILLRRNLFQLD